MRKTIWVAALSGAFAALALACGAVDRRVVGALLRRLLPSRVSSHAFLR